MRRPTSTRPGRWLKLASQATLPYLRDLLHRRASRTEAVRGATIGAMAVPGIVEDIVVDLTLEVDPAVGIDTLVRELSLPGVEIMRTASATTAWLTVLVASTSEAEAVSHVRTQVVDQIPQAARVVQTTVVTSAPLGDLHALLDTLDDDELDRVSLRDLVEAHLWNHRHPQRDLVAGRRERRARRAG